jgi:ankyrin repeat protein
MVAAQNGHDQCASTLLKAESDPKKADSEGWTTLRAGPH